MTMEFTSFDIPVFQKLLKTKEIGKQIIYKNVTETTMDDAEKAALSGSPNGTAVLAEKQIKARGTSNRQWNAENTGNIYISFIWHRIPVLQVDDHELIEVAGALAVFLSLRDLGIQDLKVKWLNDIWVRGHKMAGVLVEDKGILPDVFTDDPRKRLYILGIGVNIYADLRRNPELRMIASSARCELNGRMTSREEYLASLCSYLEELLPLDKETLYQRMIPYHLFKIGSQVKVHRKIDGKVIDGIVMEIHDDWKIIMQDKNGEKWKVSTRLNFLRPCVTSTAYIYGGKLSPNWSSTAMFNSFASLLDTTNRAIVSISDAKMKEGNWKQETSILAIGELSMSEEHSEEVHSVLTTALDFVQNGGLAFVTGNTAAMMSLYLNTTVDVKQQLKTKTSSDKEPQLAKVKAQASNHSMDLLVYSVGQPVALPVMGTNDSVDILGYYYNGNQTDNKAAIAITKYGKGNLIFISFNIEMSYVDDVSLKEDELQDFKENVFHRDAVFQEVLKKFDL